MMFENHSSIVASRSDRLFFERSGTGSHGLHKKRAIARNFRRGRRAWSFYWRLDAIFIRLEIGRIGENSRRRH